MGCGISLPIPQPLDAYTASRTLVLGAPLAPCREPLQRTATLTTVNSRPTATYWLKIENFLYPTFIQRRRFSNFWMFFIPKIRILGLSVGEDFVILACIVMTQCQHVTDRRTDRQTDRRTDNPTVANTGLCIASSADALAL